ncbi:hypothetical protein ABZS66_21680 [Dactylosporangium sp. NPDC005572]|uniref:hypothetical protein n=1 Tax=Dactylosporangium sp. NPDC005572 TaxID=3156889 RepID=UPI0033B29847
MDSPLPEADAFTAYDTVRLNAEGMLLDGREAVPPAQVARHLARLVSLPERVTDIFVFAHGWQTTAERAAASSRRLFSAIWELYREAPDRYPPLTPFRPFFVSVQWPSRSSPLPAGYRRMRDRAHAMTTTGHAAHVLAALLGYLDDERRRPAGADVLRTAGGQYLHCVGHSFGCRLLGEAIKEAAAPPEHRTLAWPWPQRFPFAVDTFLGLQMAAPPSIFTGRFRPLVNGAAPIAGPTVLTFSPHDRALALWHAVPEGTPGLGAVGAAGARVTDLRPVEEPYAAGDFTRLTSVDATWRYQDGSLVQGAHSDIWYPETVHLLLSLAALGR